MTDFKKLSVTTQVNWVLVGVSYLNFWVISQLLGNSLTMSLVFILPVITLALAIFNIFNQRERKQNSVILLLSLVPYLYYLAVFIAYWRASNP